MNLTIYGWPEHGASGAWAYCPQCGSRVRNTDTARLDHIERHHSTVRDLLTKED